MGIFGLRFSDCVGEAGGKAEICDAQECNDANNSDPRAVTLSAQIANGERDRNNAHGNRQHARDKRRSCPLKQTAGTALAMISRRGAT
jgi:hypothetical protein